MLTHDHQFFFAEAQIFPSVRFAKRVCERRIDQDDLQQERETIKGVNKRQINDRTPFARNTRDFDIPVLKGLFQLIFGETFFYPLLPIRCEIFLSL